MIIGALLGLCIVLYVVEILKHRETKKELRESDLAVVRGVKGLYRLQTKLDKTEEANRILVLDETMNIEDSREYNEYLKF